MDCLKEFNSKADLLMEKLRKQADGKTLVYLGKEMNYVALDIIASVAFGINVDSINDPSNKLFTSIQKSLFVANQVYINPFLKVYFSRILNVFFKINTILHHYIFKVWLEKKKGCERIKRISKILKKFC